MLKEKYAQEIDAILAKYPPDQRRAAVMPMIYLAQREQMHVSREDMAEIGGILGISSTEVASIVGFYSLYYDKPGGKYRLQVCTDLPCALRGADKFLESLCGNLGIRVGETTPDGLVTLEAVMCLAGCDKAPMFQLQDRDQVTYHENMTMDKTMELIDALKKGNGEVK